MPLWRFLGKGTRLFRGRTLPKTLAVIALAVAAISLRCFYPAELKLQGEGHLKPKVRKNVWAEVDGEVQEVRVEHDRKVKQGEIVLVQRSRELEKDIAAAEGELHKKESQLNSAQSELFDNKDLNETEKTQKQRDVKEFSESIKSYQKQLKLYYEKKDKLQIRSPIDGRVVTWNVKDRLLNRPVSRGENLLEIADPTQDWELEVEMPEKRMGHIAEASSQSKGPLSVTFFLATNPSKEFTGKIEEIERSAEVRGEEGNTVLVRVAFDQQELRKAVSEPKIGASATAKVHCGKRALGYVWFHDLVDFVRAKILFRIM
jgi:multidrug resistance efflux pump